LAVGGDQRRIGARTISKTRSDVSPGEWAWPARAPAVCARVSTLRLISRPSISPDRGAIPAGRARHHRPCRRPAFRWRWCFRAPRSIPPEPGPQPSPGEEESARGVDAGHHRPRPRIACLGCCSSVSCAQRRPADLSGGQRQRVLARWLGPCSRRPQVFLSMNRLRAHPIDASCARSLRPSLRAILFAVAPGRLPWSP